VVVAWWRPAEAAPADKRLGLGRTLVGRKGGTRRIAAFGVAAVALASFGVLSACGNPTQSVRHCVGAPEEAVLAIQQKLTAPGKLRNGKMVHLKGSDYSYLSAEIHLDENDRHDKGDIATWATKDVKSADGFLSVDVHAREESTWPPASFTVTEDGVIESRACTGLNTGKTKAQLECEQRESSGENVPLPSGKDCSDL
jgi:hypothetical protein